MLFGGIFDYENKQQRLAEVNGLLEDPKVWDNAEKAQNLGKEKRMLETVVMTLDDVYQSLSDSRELFDMAREESDDDTLLSVEADTKKIETTIAEMEFKRMFSQPMDANNCFIEFQSGSGGTEAQDWAGMLLRMYLRYVERKGFKVEVLEESEGDIAGIKGASIKVSGDYAFGTLRTESGVHRLVRKSPFDANSKRHPADLRIDTYRASGAGGQHINKTDSAVRITHLPTNVVVQCQNDRSQHRNKEEAMNMLKGALYNLELSKRNEEKQALEDAKTDIGWGHQIRSYVLDQGRIKDLRTNVEIGNTQGVLDGDLDPFIMESLKQGL
jgi:peptide chain release factor 2